MKKLIFLLTGLLISVPFFSQVFSPLTSGITNALGAIYFVDDYNGFAVGNGGAIVSTTNGGITWLTQTSGVTTDLSDVLFKDPAVGYVTGRSGVILKTVNGGATWTLLTSTVSTDLSRISMVGSNLYVSGYNGVMLKSSNGG